MIEMSPDAKKELRNAYNAYRSAIVAADGFVSGKRIEALKEAEKRLQLLLWGHRSYIVEQLTEKQ